VLCIDDKIPLRTLKMKLSYKQPLIRQRIRWKRPSEGRCKKKIRERVGKDVTGQGGGGDDDDDDDDE